MRFSTTATQGLTMEILSRGVGAVLAFALAACAVEEPPAKDPESPTLPDPTPTPHGGGDGINGGNCAGADEEMTASDGTIEDFQTVVADFYEYELEGSWTEVDGKTVLELDVPDNIEAMSQAFFEWPAKAIQIWEGPGQQGFSHDWYNGVFGWLARPAGIVAGTCMPALDAAARFLGMLAHVALSQAGACGQNEDGTTKFNQVNNLTLLEIGETYDLDKFFTAGVAEVVTTAKRKRCIVPIVASVPPPTNPLSPLTPTVGTTTASMDPDEEEIPCAAAFRAGVVTEGVVMPFMTTQHVGGRQLTYRPFTAAGTEPLPNSLDTVRTILRSGDMKVMHAIGLPIFAPSAEGPTRIVLTGIAGGPAKDRSPMLRPEEEAQVLAQVGDYTDRCCHQDCTPGGVIGTALVGGPAPAPPTCTTVCIPAGECRTTTIVKGVIALDSLSTFSECSGSCPEPAPTTPSTIPSCSQ